MVLLLLLLQLLLRRLLYRRRCRCTSVHKVRPASANVLAAYVS